jgi:hypothetical protein
LQIKTKIVICHTADSKPVKQEVNGTVILPPLVFPGRGALSTKWSCSHKSTIVVNAPLLKNDVTVIKEKVYNLKNETLRTCKMFKRGNITFDRLS